MRLLGEDTTLLRDTLLLGRIDTIPVEGCISEESDYLKILRKNLLALSRERLSGEGTSVKSSPQYSSSESDGGSSCSSRGILIRILYDSRSGHECGKVGRRGWGSEIGLMCGLWLSEQGPIDTPHALHRRQWLNLICWNQCSCTKIPQRGTLGLVVE